MVWGWAPWCADVFTKLFLRRRPTSPIWFPQYGSSGEEVAAGGALLDRMKVCSMRGVEWPFLMVRGNGSVTVVICSVGGGLNRI